VSERVLIDTGPIVAFLSARDAHHRRCADALADLAPPLLTCWPVVTEAAWLLRTRAEAVAKLFDSFDGGLFALLPLDADDLRPIAALLRRYRSTRLPLADAALAHLADREGIRTLFTLDRRDFSILRLKRNRALRLIPDLP
jgi:predicted nucleic acid-binding protein